MRLAHYLKTWEGTQNENKWNRLFILGLIALVLVLSGMLLTKKTIIAIQPFTLTDESWITQNQASVGYKEAWGFALSQLIGNVTPSNVSYIKEHIDRLLSPAIYNDVMTVLDVQAKQIREDRVTIRFEPRFSEYEPKTNKVFIYGYSFTRGSAKSSEIRSERTYEFTIAISNYIPVIDFMDTYKGRPRTVKVLEKLQRTEEKEKRRGGG